MTVWRACSPLDAVGKIVARIIGRWPPVGGRACRLGLGRRPGMTVLQRQPVSGLPWVCGLGVYEGGARIVCDQVRPACRAGGRLVDAY